MQIIAKTALSILGLHVAVVLYSNLETTVGMLFYRIHNPPPLISITYLCVFALLVLLLIVYFVFRNNGLAVCISGSGEHLPLEQQRKWLIISLRLALFFYGFALLSDTVGTIIRFLFTVMSSEVGDWLTYVLNSRSLPPALDLVASRWCGIIVNATKACLACYFIFGAPHFIRWQLKHSVIEHCATVFSEGQDDESK